MIRVNIPWELEEALWVTLYHHEHGGAIVLKSLLGKKFETPPDVPTERQKELAEEMAKHLLRFHYARLNFALLKLTGEGLEHNPFP
jgi:hypothetical protein